MARNKNAGENRLEKERQRNQAEDTYYKNALNMLRGASAVDIPEIDIPEPAARAIGWHMGQ
jgi:hypothetical protein